MNEEVIRRLRKYLERDRSGIRRALLKIVLSGEKLTTEEIQKRLAEMGYNLNIRGVSAMVGLMSARLGILKLEIGEKNKYYLKKEYESVVKEILQEFEKK
ncbi:conserved hypothetical protein [Ferroglobus placidus DSM 10642]|uniref:DUF2551 domain-containing protein n=1 Tax=Ferroglobus placidus (strain DSM 10642 / AEDII12DO) TaxID=589924 RepID=D3S060_FERPA|nr:DUF2551 domain-containing protein [Ferroglobus placidus]ADC66123.1 conserved hypothetical protein [Ferroglobus placidus DSM 10642]